MLPRTLQIAHTHEVPCPKPALELSVLDTRPCCTSLTSVPFLPYPCWQASSCSLVSCQDLSCQTSCVPAQVATWNCTRIGAALAFAGHCNTTQHRWGHKTEIPTSLHLQSRAFNQAKLLESQISVFPQPVLVLPLSQQCAHNETDFFHQPHPKFNKWRFIP